MNITILCYSNLLYLFNRTRNSYSSLFFSQKPKSVPYSLHRKTFSKDARFNEHRVLLKFATNYLKQYVQLMEEYFVSRKPRSNWSFKSCHNNQWKMERKLLGPRRNDVRSVAQSFDRADESSLIRSTQLRVSVSSNFRDVPFSYTIGNSSREIKKVSDSFNDGGQQAWGSYPSDTSCFL